MKPHQGFSLIEMAFVLVIITLLLGGLLVPFATQVEQRRITETQKSLEEIKEAVIGFAIVNGRMPCPDATAGAALPNINNDGLEDRSGSTCNAQKGNLPWATLGITPSDAWGNRFRYELDLAYATSSTISFSTTAQLTVCDKAPPAGNTFGNTTCPALTLAKNVPAVILSYGKNGYGATNSNGTVNRQATSADELENAPNSFYINIFVSRTITPPETSAGEFDDLVTWISPNILFNRMVAAGKLP